MQKKYKISVIIPVYNVEKYIEETVESVLKQSIGFKENIQLILVNDGSTDNSEKICLRYKEKYPENIVYVYQKNAGVSAARNNGLDYADGEFVNFLDSDDKWDKDAFKKAYNMLKNNDNINLVCFRLKYFELSNKYHWLDYKFTGDRIVDIFKEPNAIAIHGATIIFRKSAIGDIRFDETLRISEDTKFIYQVVLQKKHYGIISSSKYNYRKRNTQSSAIQTSRQRDYWYIDTLNKCQNFLVNLSIEKYGKVIPFVQYFIMYDLLWRIKSNVGCVLSNDEKKQYENLLCNLLKNIDDDVIMEQNLITHNYKLLCFKIKYGDDFYKKIAIKNNGIYYNKLLCTEFKEFNNTMEIFNIDGNILKIRGRFDYIENAEFYYKINGNLKKIDTYIRYDKQLELNKNHCLDLLGYSLDLDISNIKSIEFLIKINKKYHSINNNFIHFSMLSNFKFSYYTQNNYLITSKNYSTIKIKHKPLKIGLVFREIRYLLSILLINKRVDAAGVRIVHWITKPFLPKNIWLFCDREFMAKDSGELLFRYVNKQKNLNKRNTYFVVDKRYKDFERMKKYGNVVSYHTLKYKLLFLNAKYLISSHADSYVNNEFGNSKRYYIDLYKFKYIYLTHGILLHDSSLWLNKINKNIYLNVVTSHIEKEALLSDKYYFDENDILMSGLPRYDNLIQKNVKVENKILFMPSWRANLAASVIASTQRRIYNPNFKDSDYYKFYNKLLNDSKLLNILKEKNLKIKFCVHPSFRAQFKDFIPNDYVKFAIDVDSQYETLSSKFIVTDYSSAACDFAYLRKPVIYANFDYDKIYTDHYYKKGLFDYDRDGFGPNCTKYDDVLNAIIDCINNECKMEKKYIERCNNFFYYSDNNNCKRIYDKLIKLDKEKK